MSIVARVFVVLNLILSIVFLVFAMQIWTAPTKWQKMYEVERKKNIELKADFQDRVLKLSMDVVQKEEVLKGRKQDIITYKKDINKLRDEKLELQGKLGEAESRANMQQAHNEELMRELSRRADELVKLKGVLIKQQQAVAVARENEGKARNEKAELENDVNSLRQQVATLSRDKRVVEEDLAQQSRRIEALLARGVPIVELIGEDPETLQPYTPDAQVLAVKPDLDLVMISIGSNQGVKPGFRFTVSRGDQYIAKVQVEKVYPDMCSARLVAGLKKADPAIHDTVRSRVPHAQ